MKFYDYEIVSDCNQLRRENKFLLEEEFTSSAKTNYILRLQNNQNREVALVSDSSFENIKKNQQIGFLVKDILSFTYTIGSKKILYHKAEKGNDKLRDYWLYHTFLPILFTFEDIYYILHAGAVTIHEIPTLFIADSFGGKSTLIDFFIKKGHSMISDDKVPVFINDSSVHAVPSYPYHRPYRKMEDLGVLVENFFEKKEKIGFIFNLKKSQPNSQIKIDEIFGVDKFMALRYATDIDLPINKNKKFEKLTQIANLTRVYNITIPWDLNRLEEVYVHITNFIKEKKNEY